MIRAYVYYNRTLAGYLLKNRRRYVFLYDRNYTRIEKFFHRIESPES